MLHKEFNNELRAYPTHQAVQTIGSTAHVPIIGEDLFLIFEVVNRLLSIKPPSFICKS